MMTSLFRSLSQRFRRSKRHRHPGGGGTPGTSDYQQGFNQPEMDPRKQFQCKVMLLDGTDMNVIVSKNAIGQELYDQVFYALDLEERDYFGLQFMDHYHVQHWLDPIKRISKQIPIGPPYTLRFRVKFYSSEPNNLREELTRYQFFLQLKQDIQTGKLECPKDTAVELAALALQSELGDYNPVDHTPALISEFRFHPEQDEEMEIAILEKFITCRGQSPATAEMNYLNKAKWIELYGVDMHTVEGRDGNLYKLGLTPTGMLVFDGSQKIGLFLWEKIQKLDFKNRKITLVVEEDADQASGQVQLHTFVFNLSSHKACKHLWKCAIEHHTFFRLKYHKPRNAKASQLFRLGSTFRYRGRTEYENVHKDGGRLSRRQSATFERRPSQRYGPRQSLLNKRIQIRNDFKQQVGAFAGLPVPDLVAPTEILTTLDEDKRKLLNGNGFTNADAKAMVNGCASSSSTSTPTKKMTTMQNGTNDEQMSGIKELDMSPSAARRQYNSTKGSTNSTPTSLPLTSNIQKPESLDTTLSMVHETNSRWSGSTGPITTAVGPATGHVTTIAINNNGSQIHTPSRIPTSPLRIQRQNGTPLMHTPPSNNNSMSPLAHISPITAASPNTHQSHIPRNFSESISGTKSSGSSVSGPATPTSMHQTSPSKTNTGLPIRSPLSTPVKIPLSQTSTPSSEGAFRDSIITNEPAYPATAGGISFIRHPSAINNRQQTASTIPTPTVSTPSTAATVTRTDTFTISDQKKPFQQTEDSIRSESCCNNKLSLSHPPEPQTRIPHLRTMKPIGTIGSKKSYISPASSTSAMQVSERNAESADKAYRSRLPVRSARGGGSSMTTSETHESRASSGDEKTSHSRIPVMANSMHRPHSQMQSAGQIEKYVETSYLPAVRTGSASTNSRIITDL